MQSHFLPSRPGLRRSCPVLFDPGAVRGFSFNELALFAGAGGGILGGKLLGWRTVCAVEFDPYARAVLISRQNDGCLPAFPIWDDVRTFDGRPWAGIVDVISGGFPCQDISCAGKGAGIDGERSGLWGEMFRVVREVGPRFVFVENSPMLTSRGLGRVLGDLASVGYDAEWTVLGADDVGAPHRRERIWILAHAAGHGRSERGTESTRGERRPAPVERGASVAHAASVRQQGPGVDGVQGYHASGCGGQADQPFDAGEAKSDWWEFEPGVGGVVDGLAPGLDIHGAASAGDVGRVATGVRDRVGRLKSLGNGQVPEAARTAFLQLRARIK